MAKKFPKALLDQPKSKIEMGSKSGVWIIQEYLKTLPGKPGVYRMIDSTGRALYVGKAKNLKKRVTSYTMPERQSVRIRRMIGLTASMEFVTTHTEAEALLLEANMIKRLAPRYNILLRDDKSFPYIQVTAGHDFPKILKYRGAQNKPGDYFGPFASVWAVNETLTVLQRAFLLRSCTDSVFTNRTRPCLLHQIKRCAAPCVGKIGVDEYKDLVDQARGFLAGNSSSIQKEFAKRMQAASDALEFELAAQYRDRIRALTRVQAHQDISLAALRDADIVAVHQSDSAACVQVFFFRSGANFGNRAYFPTQTTGADAEEVLEAFLGQFYARTPPPHTVLISHAIANRQLIENALSVHAGHRVSLAYPQRGDKLKLVRHAERNAAEALSRRLAESASQRRLLKNLVERLGLDGAPERIEVFDNSHVSGTNAIGAMIVTGPDGFIKNAYRKFNIRGARDTSSDGYSPGDDYAMMREVLTRRFSRALREDPDRSGGQWPDLVLVDGGKGQLGIAVQVFEDLGINDMTVAAIAKGPGRNAGGEQIFQPGVDVPVVLKDRDAISYFLQRIRDEAHRFAIGSHRSRRSSAIGKSILDEIPGVGSQRKKALLHHFGDPKAISNAGKADLVAVDGISDGLAAKIYDWFHVEV